MGQEKWEMLEAGSWLLADPYVGVLHDPSDPSSFQGAPVYSKDKYLDEVDWKDAESRDAFEAFLNNKNTEDWKNTRFLSTLEPGMEFGDKYKIVASSDKRFIPEGYKAIGSLDDFYRPGYTTGSDRIRQTIPSSSFPGYTILEKVKSEPKKEKPINFEPIDFNADLNDDGFNYKPSPEKILYPSPLEVYPRQQLSGNKQVGHYILDDERKQTALDKALPFDKYLSNRIQDMDQDRTALMV